MTDERCATHRRQPAVTSCAGCQRSLCRACVVHTGVGFKCADCTGSPTPSAHPTAQRLRSWRPSAVGVAITMAALILIGAAAFAIFRPSPVQQVGGQLGSADAGPTAVDVAFDAEDDLTLRGTLDVPEDHEGHAPAVVVVPGFGPTDRDGVIGSPGDPLYRDLADALTERGMVVLRYDKRGAGESDRIPEDNPLTFEQRVGDAAAAVAHVRERPEVDAGHVAVIGHDEGGLAGLRVAGDDANLAGLVLVGTPGRPFVEVVAEAYRDPGDDEHDAVAEEIERAVDELLATGEMPEVDYGVGMGIEQVLPEGDDEYLYGLFSADPVADAADVSSPALIVHGEQDPNINHDTDVEPLREALAEVTAVDVLTAPDAGHTLNVVDEEEEPGGEMGAAPGPVERDEGAVGDLAAWLVDQVAEHGG